MYIVQLVQFSSFIHRIRSFVRFLFGRFRRRRNSAGFVGTARKGIGGHGRNNAGNTGHGRGNDGRGNGRNRTNAVQGLRLRLQTRGWRWRNSTLRGRRRRRLHPRGTHRQFGGRWLLLSRLARVAFASIIPNICWFIIVRLHAQHTFGALFCFSGGRGCLNGINLFFLS